MRYGSPFGAAYLLRGHADASWRLRSSLMRLLPDGVSAEDALDAEENLLDVFRAQSHLHLRGHSLPDDDDFVGWWALMQR